MKLVVDSNRIIASLIKDSFSRQIILSEKFEFITLEFGVEEVKKYKNYILKKARLNEVQFNEVMNCLLLRMEVIDAESISKQNYLEAKRLMDKIDENDAPFIALALQEKTDGIWSDDKHFLKQKKIKIWQTKTLNKKI